jgi:uncharacterized membrane protein YphA (DoxX/SURF4 family)
MFINGINDEFILAARLLLTTLFLIFGWRKLRDFSGTVSQMVELGVPAPVLAAGVATFMELPVAFAVAIGMFVRPSALLLFLYTIGTALIGHRYFVCPTLGEAVLAFDPLPEGDREQATIKVNASGGRHLHGGGN